MVLFLLSLVILFIVVICMTTVKKYTTLIRKNHAFHWLKDRRCMVISYEGNNLNPHNVILCGNETVLQGAVQKSYRWKE